MSLIGLRLPLQMLITDGFVLDAAFRTHGVIEDDLVLSVIDCRLYDGAVAARAQQLGILCNGLDADAMPAKLALEPDGVAELLWMIGCEVYVETALHVAGCGRDPSALHCP